MHVDPLSGRKVVVAPGRAARPGGQALPSEPPSERELADCPFCEGRETRTPPELLVLGVAAGRQPDSPGWQLRVVPNLYPAFEHQQVVVHSPEHVRSLAELTPEQIGLVARAWQELSRRAESAGRGSVLALVNEGRSAGASLPHSHSQVVWMREDPPEVERERAHLREGTCALCALLGRRELEISTRKGVTLLAAPAGRAPYELLIAPLAHLGDGFADSALLPLALELAAEAIRRLQRLEGHELPLNLWLHSFRGDGHWHIELLPRLTVMAGIELGAGISINTLAPEEAARRMRLFADEGPRSL
ncbi:MAG: galactose-1-phosphate uridylyltransferase [Gaiellaceae bacterium]